MLVFRCRFMLVVVGAVKGHFCFVFVIVNVWRVFAFVCRSLVVVVVVLDYKLLVFFLLYILSYKDKKIHVFV